MLLETDDEILFEISLDPLRSFKDNQKNDNELARAIQWKMAAGPELPKI